MNTWMRMGIGVAALALSVGIGAGAYAMYGADDAPKQQTVDAAPQAAGEDASAGGGSRLAAMCVAGVADCNDTPGIEYDDFGDTSARCAAEAIDCIEPAACPPEGCPAMAYESCTTAIDGDGSSVTTCVGCAPAQPAPAPPVAPAPGEPAIELPAPELDPADGGPAVDVPPAPDFDPGMAGTGCLGVDPCWVSARPLCVPGACTVSSDGVVECPYIPPCNIPKPVPGETEVRPMPVDVPCVVSPCAGIDPSAGAPERCRSDPCSIYRASQPEGVPCDRVEPCTIPDPVMDALEGGMQMCPPVPGGSGGGSSGSGGSSSEGSPTESLPPPPE